MDLDSATIVVFAYDFEHKKTQDILLRLFLEEIPVHMVVGAPRVDLGVSEARIRTKVRHRGYVHPRRVAERIGARYAAVPHDGPEILDLLGSLEPDLGIVAGARILSADVIDTFGIGIINLHPGLIPEVRGLDAMLWAIHDDQPQGVTAHLIDKYVDAGNILERRRIPLHRDDTAFDLQERLYEMQLDMLEPAVRAALEDEGTGRVTETADRSVPYHRRMSRELMEETLGRLPDYLERYAD